MRKNFEKKVVSESWLVGVDGGCVEMENEKKIRGSILQSYKRKNTLTFIELRVGKG